MGCPQGYDDKLKALLGAQKHNKLNRSLNMVAYKCTKCPKWHLRNER